jgi:UDP-N-acetylmuramate--alanine ligase
MSGLAQFQVMSGGQASGSDRSFSFGQNLEMKKQFKNLSISLFPQDGSGIDRSLDAVIVSTAIEENNDDLKKAKSLGIPVFHRSQVLALWASRLKTIAVTGTSGKSTVTAMIFEILLNAGWSPSIITGANLINLQKKGLLGNAFVGESDLLVIEADESDGSLIEYSPFMGVLLNMQKDHKEINELKKIFSRFLSQCTQKVVNGDAGGMDELKGDASLFSMSGQGDICTDQISYKSNGSIFSVQGIHFTVPLPGRFNVENSLAAIAACSLLGLKYSDMVNPLKAFKGIARRFEKLGEKNGVSVIDDFAHNPSKIMAALEAAHMRSKRVIAVFQPHGFAPTRFLKNDYIHVFKTCLAKADILFMPEIFYAGGTATKDISSADIIQALFENGYNCFFFKNRRDIVQRIKTEAKRGDTVIVMGARDPGLPQFSREVLEALD